MTTYDIEFEFPSGQLRIEKFDSRQARRIGFFRALSNPPIPIQGETLKIVYHGNTKPKTIAR